MFQQDYNQQEEDLTDFWNDWNNLNSIYPEEHTMGTQWESECFGKKKKKKKKTHSFLK